MAAHPIGGSDRPLVAIVDDDQSVGRAISRLVRHLGMDVEAFVSGSDFLEHLNAVPERPPDCVVLDVQMPGGGGLHVQQCLSERKATCGVVMMTAYHDPDGQQRATALAMGAAAFLQKPFEADVFIDAVNHALAGCRTRRGHS